MATETIDLVNKIRLGEDVRESQEELYSRVRQELLGQIERKLASGVRSRLDAEDVLHEAFMRGMRALDLFHPRSDSALFAWIYTIAKNLMLDQLKRRSVNAVHFAAGDEGDGPRASQVHAVQRRPESLLMGRDWIGALLGRLSEKEAEVIRLHKLEGISFAEIAASWGKTAGAVQRSYSRAWQKLCQLAASEKESS